MSKEWWLRRRRRAWRRYPTLKVRKGGGEKISFVQGKEQRLEESTCLTSGSTTKLQ